MFKYFHLIVIVLHLSNGQHENQDWEIAVVANDQIELLNLNGTLIGSTFQQFTKLKALTFDNIRHQFVVSDMDQMNDTIFTVQLTKETDITPILEDLPDDVQGLAIDPITDILYWTDSINHTINYLHLNDTNPKSEVLFSFPAESPHGLAIDICHRYIYWTNSDINRPTIERAFLNGSNHQVLVDFDLHQPTGIAIDYKSQRLYWTDHREGIYYRIESTNLEGKEREITFEGTHSKPFGIAINDYAIYWTDTNNNALWKISKNQENSIPERLRGFKEKPMGIITKNIQIQTLPDCQNLAQAIKLYNESTIERIKPVAVEIDTNDSKEIFCLNGGERIGNGCKCRRGYTGLLCDIPLCHNYCVRGDCHLSSLGYPQCRCPSGYAGSRCERVLCNDICIDEICRMFCSERDEDTLMSERGDLLCRCSQGTYTIVKSNTTKAEKLSKRYENVPTSASSLSFIDHFRDPYFGGLIIITCIMFLLFIMMIVYVHTLKRRRPRIKKRIIVNKNVTPLTYRPQSTTEQCEITIENCCNMNVCETPCFEPRNKKDDKKTLLSNMENGEDLSY